MTAWQWIAVLGMLVAAATAVGVAEALKGEPKSPAVACIEQRGDWQPGWGSLGWSGTCKFEQEKGE